jgi:flagellin
MQELHSILHRVRELAVQYLNGPNDASARLAITTEVEQLHAEFNRMVNGANFNGTLLLSGQTAAAQTITLQVGPNQSASDSLALTLPNLTDTGTAPYATPTNGVSIETMFDNFEAGTTATTLQDVDEIVNGISAARAQMGAIQNRLEHTVNALGIYQENLMAAESRIRDVDMAQEMTNYTKLQILQQSGTAMLAQANQSTSSVLQLLQG